MPARDLIVGDLAILTIGDARVNFVVRRIERDGIYISPANNFTNMRKLVMTNLGFRIEDDLNTDYKITFAEDPVKQAPIVKSPTHVQQKRHEDVARTIDTMLTSDEKEIAEICATLSINPRTDIDQEKIDKMRQFGELNSLPELTDTLYSRRVYCNEMLEKVINKLDPTFDAGKIGANLGRHYNVIRDNEEADRVRRIQAREERERLERERLEIIRKTELIERAKEKIRSDRQTELKMTFHNTVICPDNLIIRNVGALPIIDRTLLGRRVLISQDYWRSLFNRQPVDLHVRTAIANEIRRNYNIDIAMMDNTQIRGLLGDDMIHELIGDVTLDIPQQIHLKIEPEDLTSSFALISGFHNEGDDIIKISEITNNDVGGWGAVNISDCPLDQIDTIGLLLLRNGDIPDINEDFIKSSLVDQIADVGILTVGDTLDVTIDQTKLSYVIEKLTTVNGTDVIAAAIPPIGTDVKILLNIEKKEDLKAKIEQQIGEDVDVDML